MTLISILLIETGQEMIFYDVLANHEREREYLGSAITAVKSSSSTKILLGELTTEIPAISVRIFNNISKKKLFKKKPKKQINSSQQNGSDFCLY